MYIYIYICMCIYIYIYIYTHTPWAGAEQWQTSRRELGPALSDTYIHTILYTHIHIHIIVIHNICI